MIMRPIHGIPHIFARPGGADIHQPGVSTPGGVAAAVNPNPPPIRLGLNPIGLHTSWPALEGRIFTSLGFQPQVGWRGGHWWSVSAVRAPSRLGLKPQATQYPPFQGGSLGHASETPLVDPRVAPVFSRGRACTRKRSPGRTVGS